MPDHVVVVGASLAGLRAIEEARATGYRGKLTLIGAEAHLPYDRPPLSKDFIHGGEGIAAPHFPGVHELVSDLDVDLRLGRAAGSLDLAGRTIEVAGETLSYDEIIIATGASARALPGTGQLSGVHTLRTIDDALAIRSALDDRARTVVIGAGFIGSEVASSARKRGLAATVVEAMPTPLVRAVGEHAGAALSQLHLRNGTDLRCGVGVSGLEGQTQVTGVRLLDGTLLPADLVVVGIGAAPATGWLQGSGLTIDNGVVCGPDLAAAPGVWAAGDVARWMSPDFGSLIRLEHWTNAGDQGAHAMRNALSGGNPTAYHHIPYFWSDWYGHRIQFAGLATGIPTVVTGSFEGDEFTALYRDGDQLAGALTLNRRGDIMKYRSMIGRRASWDESLVFAAGRKPVLI